MQKLLLSILILYLLTCSLFAQETDSTYTAEKLKFSAGFRWVSAGEASMEMQQDTLNGAVINRLNFTTRTNSFLDKFFKIRYDITVWLDQEDLQLLKVKKNIRERRKKKKHSADIDTLNHLAITESDTLDLPGKVYDPISVIYFLRQQDLSIGETIHFSTYDNGKVREVYVNVEKEDRVAVPAGIFNCVVISPTSADGKQLLKNKGQMKVWLSDDDQKLPVRIEQKTDVGTMLLELEKVIYKELKKPGYVVEHDHDEEKQ